jgi:hypothetical protein
MNVMLITYGELWRLTLLGMWGSDPHGCGDGLDAMETGEHYAGAEPDAEWLAVSPPEPWRAAYEQLVLAALKRGIERGRGTTWAWDDTEWLADELRVLST